MRTLVASVNAMTRDNQTWSSSCDQQSRQSLLAYTAAQHHGMTCVGSLGSCTTSA